MTLAGSLFASGSDSSTVVREWFGNSDFSFSESSESLCIRVDKRPWECFTLRVSEEELRKNPVLEFWVSASSSLELRIEVSDGSFLSSDPDFHSFWLSGSSEPQRVSCDFSQEVPRLEPGKSVYVLFTPDPGREFKGTLCIQRVSLGERAKEKTRELLAFLVPARDHLNLSLPRAKETVVSAFDPTGKRVLEERVFGWEGGDYSVFVGDLPRGTLVIRAASDESNSEAKVILIN